MCTFATFYDLAPTLSLKLSNSSLISSSNFPKYQLSLWPHSNPTLPKLRAVSQSGFLKKISFSSLIQIKTKPLNLLGFGIHYLAAIIGGQLLEVEAEFFLERVPVMSFAMAGGSCG